MPDPDWPDGPLDAAKTTLYAVIEDTGAITLQYLYDFGDGWEHTIKIDKVFKTRPDDREACPMLLAASGRCPPEDVGGPSGYAKFLEAIGDRERERERHNEITRWIGANFDPSTAPSDYINQEFGTFAKRWAPRQNHGPATSMRKRRRTQA